MDARHLIVSYVLLFYHKIAMTLEMKGMTVRGRSNPTKCANAATNCSKSPMKSSNTAFNCLNPIIIQKS